VRFHPKALIRALIVASAFATLLLLGMDPKAGVVAILAIATVDALSFLLPLGLASRRRGGARERGESGLR